MSGFLCFVIAGLDPAIHAASLRSTMSNSDVVSRASFTVPAMPTAPESSFKLAQIFASRRTGGISFCFPQMREAERRTAHPFPIAAPDEGHSRGHCRPLAFRRSTAVLFGPGRASWNHRMQTGGPSPAPVQRAPRGPTRAGRDDAQAARERSVSPRPTRTAPAPPQGVPSRRRCSRT